LELGSNGDSAPKSFRPELASFLDAATPSAR